MTTADETTVTLTPEQWVTLRRGLADRIMDLEEASYHSASPAHLERQVEELMDVYVAVDGDTALIEDRT